MIIIWNWYLPMSTYFIQNKSKVLQYFGNMRHNMVTPDSFAKVMKVTNHTWLWNASATCWICFYVTALESTVLSWADIAWLLRFLQPEWNFFNHLVTVLWLTNLTNLIHAFLIFFILVFRSTNSSPKHLKYETNFPMGVFQLKSKIN